MHFLRVTDHWAGYCTGGRFLSDHKHADHLKTVQLLELMLGDQANIVKHVDNMDPMGGGATSAELCAPTLLWDAATYSWWDTSLIDWVINGNHSESWETWAVDVQRI